MLPRGNSVYHPVMLFWTVGATYFSTVYIIVHIPLDVFVSGK